MTIEVGQQLLHYRLDRKIGQGGMGVVYEATDTRLDRRVAVKVLPPELTRDADRSARFRREARIAASLNHPNLATVHDVGEQDGVTFLVMELVEGASIRRVLGDTPLGVEPALEIAIGIASGLARAHREGVVHRDLKPDNVVLTGDGVPKILDFGLGKLIDDGKPLDGPADTEMATATAKGSPPLTRAGQVLGTLAYMSPEQLHGRPVDARSDVFSFGVLLYEMFAGKRPFGGESGLDIMTSILRDDPAPLETLRRDAPPDLQAVLARCLAKDPSDRFPSGEALHDALSAVRRALDARASGPAALFRRPAVLAAAAVVLALAVGASVWWARRSARLAWAGGEAVAEIERLWDAGDKDGAMRRLRGALEILPDDPRLLRQLNAFAIPMSIESDPPGADVYVKGYDRPERPWIPLGETPIDSAAVIQPVRLRIEKDGFLPFEGAPFGVRRAIRLFRESEAPERMVFVPAGGVGFGAVDAVALDDFWIDTFEVTNRAYKAFVDAGGYREDRWWPDDVDRGAFVDTTGRPGPSGWTIGDYPEGEDDLPVGGVSWFEAMAYASWAGKSLPTVFHWRHAAEQGIFSEILLWSNFDAEGPAAVGTYAGLGPAGTYDMAGNLREWCFNRIGTKRYILGGAWSEPNYLYRSTDAMDPHDRSSINGFRCVKTSGPIPETARVAIEQPVDDHRRDTAIDDDLYAVVRRDFDYDPRELDPELRSEDDASEAWRHEIVSIRAAYGDERFPIHLFLPRDAEPPYQAVVYFPPSSARYLPDSRRPNFPFAYFIPRSGRALILPIYQGTYERRFDLHGPNDYRDHTIQAAKDLRRTIDYLETREDIDSGKLAYYGLSWGASLGPVMTAVETRFSTSLLVSGGLYRFTDHWPPAAVPQNFAPRSTLPTIMINGKDDFGAPVETNIRPMFEMLGTPDEHKRLVLLEGGHVPVVPQEVIREVLDWLDHTLGPV